MPSDTEAPCESLSATTLNVRHLKSQSSALSDYTEIEIHAERNHSTAPLQRRYPSFETFAALRHISEHALALCHVAIATGYTHSASIHRYIDCPLSKPGASIRGRT